MAALDFPASPTVGQIYPAVPVTGQSQYQWSGTYWIAIGQLGDFVKKSGDVMTGVLTVTPKGSMIGVNGGTTYNGAVVQGDANIKLYAVDANNWCGLGVDPAGNFWLRTGTSGSPTPAVQITAARNVALPGSLNVTGNIATNGNVNGSAIAASSTLSGAQIISNGAVYSNNGRLMAYSLDGAPSMTVYAGNRSTAYGFWNGYDNTFSFGNMDGAGNPSSRWGYLEYTQGLFLDGPNGVNVYSYAGDSQPYISTGLRVNPAWNMSLQGIHYASNWVGMRIDAGNGGPFFDFRNDGYAYCPGGTWIATSDARIKNVLGDYTNGLDAIAALHPVRFKYKANNTYEAPSHYRTGVSDEEKAKTPEPKGAPSAPYKNSPQYTIALADKELIGLLAQEAEVSMPELVMRSKGHIDGVAVDDLRDMNTTPLFFALINAVKELKARVEELEAKLA